MDWNRWVRGVIMGCILVGLVSCLGTARVAAEEAGVLEAWVVEQLNLGSKVQLEEYSFENNQVLLWREPADDRPEYAKNWGIVLLKKGEPQHLWFYNGPLTNAFQDFHLSFHQFTQDGRKELAIVGTDEQRRDWAYFFILNLEEQGVSLLHHGETNARGGSYFVQAAEIYNQGMFLDLDLDHIEELFVYREVQGSILPGPIWPDIYNWNGQRFVKHNEKYPTFYIPFFEAFKAGAQEEEQLADGKYQIYYEHMAQIYELWDEPIGVAKAKERALLPPLAMGEKMVELMQTAGFQTHRMVRADLDGMAPLDAVIWGKGSEGARNKVWLIGQQGDKLVGPFEVVLPAHFFDRSQEIQIRSYKSLVEFSYPADLGQPGLAYVYQFSTTGAKLVGREEQRLLLDGIKERKVAGQTLDDLEVDDASEINWMPLLQGSQSQERVRIDGIFSDAVWSNIQPVQVGGANLILKGLGNWGHQDDLSLAVQSAYQGDTLYLGVRVTDDIKWYTQKAGVQRSQVCDHLEIWLEDQGELYHYGLFLEATGVAVVEWVDGQGQKPTHQIEAQWMPASQGYWVELAIAGLDLTQEVVPITLGVMDVDEKDSSEIKTILATSRYRAGEVKSLGWIRLQ